MSKKQKHIPELPNNANLDLLPDDFSYNYYLDLSKSRDLSRWAVEFSARQSYDFKIGEKSKLTKEFIKKIGGLRYDTESKYAKLRTQWVNGVYTNKDFSIAEIVEYFHRNIGAWLHDNNGVFIPNEEINKMIINKVPFIENNQNLYKSNYGNPSKDYYQGYTGKKGDTYFTSEKEIKNFESKVSNLENITASFLVNIEMPTEKIINEIKNHIDYLKDTRNINEIDTTIKSENYFYWAVGLGCYDLKHVFGLKNTEIQGGYLSLVYDGYSDGVSDTTDVGKKRFSRCYNQALEMINGDCKKLIGNPI